MLELKLEGPSAEQLSNKLTEFNQKLTNELQMPSQSLFFRGMSFERRTINILNPVPSEDELFPLLDKYQLEKLYRAQFSIDDFSLPLKCEQKVELAPKIFGKLSTKITRRSSAEKRQKERQKGRELLCILQKLQIKRAFTRLA
jgi:hypothetical protein